MAKGRHLLIDCRAVPRSVCEDDGKFLETIAQGARNAGANVISQVRYHFGHNSPPGFTLAVLLDESHCTAHCYSETGHIAIDMFTCGSTNPWEILEYVREHIDLGEVSATEIGRFYDVDEESPMPVMSHTPDVENVPTATLRTSGAPFNGYNR